MKGTLIALTCALVLAPGSLWADEDLAEDELQEEGEQTDDERSIVELGILVGGGFYQINAPADPAGSLTFLYGSAFSGGGFTIGATSVFDLMPLFGLEADLLISYTSLSGSAESQVARRDITIDEIDLRLDLLARLKYAFPNPEIELGLGPEIVFGLNAGIVETLTGQITDDDLNATPLEPDTGVWLFLVAQTGVNIRAGRFTIPVLFRAGWNPFYPDTTADRFGSFESPDNPGPLTVGTDWYVTALVGVRYGL